ncbi:MAG: redox-sensing transcriptional repressor Rex [Clostridia bacterium]|nr:redox-sensing transcriptional repressor Rex [Clostridia bacterium]MBR2327922.1 redox-sensing transcriptional repressor Rex [Clostridia bacterium]
MKKVPVSVVRRLPRYFRYLNELYKQNKLKVSSKELSEQMNVTASQIRQDFNHFGGFGQQGYGYNVPTLNQEMAQILGVNENFTAIVVGIGNLGHAIVNNVNFGKRGVKILGIFDSDPEKIGNLCGKHRITDIQTIEEFCEKSRPDIAVLTLPKSQSREMFERLKRCGIKGFWNFTNAEIRSEKGVAVENVHLADSLMLLTYSLREQNGEE